MSDTVMPTPQPSCPNYSICYSTAMKCSNANKLAKEQSLEMDTFKEKIDELNALLTVNVDSATFKRDIGTFKRLQALEETQRRACDFLEQENGRLRVLLSKAGVDFSPAAHPVDVELSPVVTGFLQ